MVNAEEEEGGEGRFRNLQSQRESWGATGLTQASKMRQTGCAEHLRAALMRARLSGSAHGRQAGWLVSFHRKAEGSAKITRNCPQCDRRALQRPRAAVELSVHNTVEFDATGVMSTRDTSKWGRQGQEFRGSDPSVCACARLGSGTVDAVLDILPFWARLDGAQELSKQRITGATNPR